MLRCTTALLLLVAITGCRQSAFNPYAPFGSPRVPPPGTGAVTSPNTYYPGKQGPASVPPSVDVSRRNRDPDLSANEAAASAGWQQRGSVSVASYDAPEETPARTDNPPASSTGTAKLKGMPVNDATGNQLRSEPRVFQPSGPVTDINNLPPASNMERTTTTRSAEATGSSTGSSGWKRRR